MKKENRLDVERHQKSDQQSQHSDKTSRTQPDTNSDMRKIVEPNASEKNYGNGKRGHPDSTKRKTSSVFSSPLTFHDF